MAKMITYRIPDTQDAVQPNPSARLRKIGFRPFNDGSVWVIPDGREPWHLLKELKDNKCFVTMVRFDDNEHGTLLELGRTAMLMALEANEKRAQQTCDRAVPKYGESDDPNAPARFKVIMKEIITRTEKLMEDMRLAAQGFGWGVPYSSEDVMGKVERIRAVAEAKAAAYVAMTQKVAETDPELAKAAENDEVPAGILADHLEDQGLDVSAMRELMKEKALETTAV